ncbi:MAG: hypothetical protein R3F41_07520 [Gammaproteobacteria bacterium]|nr:hypothetical protein [Pseudomonadales bacterium]MCP5348772.1 hypothetical protein [Pseudomonadales bacterium]
MLLDFSQAPVTETSLASYFKKRLTRYAQRLRPPPHDDTCWYLGNVLDRFGRSDQLFYYQDGHVTLRPLALLYGDALRANNDRERCLLLQQLGDMALFLGALFPERFARHGIQRDYFIGMGGSAYDYLADNARQNRHIFSELAHMFGRMLEMVADACARTNAVSAADILALYQRWLDTGDPLAEKQLRSLGIELNGSQRLQ